MEFPRQECRSGCGLPFPPSGHLPSQGSKLCLFHLLDWQLDSLPLCHPSVGPGRAGSASPSSARWKNVRPPVLALFLWCWIPKSVCNPLTTSQSSFLLPSAAYSEFMWLAHANTVKTISRHRPLQKRVTFLIKKRRKSEGTANAVGQPPERPGKVDSFHGLLDSFYSLKIKKIPDGRAALHDWLGAVGGYFT